jgi:hypothetical protein
VSALASRGTLKVYKGEGKHGDGDVNCLMIYVVVMGGVRKLCPAMQRPDKMS